MRIFESHAHYDDMRYNSDRDELLASLKDFGVEYVINVGADMQSSVKSLNFCNKYTFFYAAVGVHPHEAESMTDADIDILREMAKNPRAIAIGEIGLDYFYDHSPRDIQLARFKDQLKIAEELKKPVIIHSRDASQQTYDVLAESSAGENGGVIHCFSQSAEMAVEYVKLGFHIGIGGVVTFPKARNVVEAVEKTPMEKLLVETDCPYLSPAPHRGERNSSQYLRHIINKISEIKQISPEEVAEITTANAKQLFGII